MCVDLNLEKNSIIQEYVSNPFLVDGRRFSLGVFVAFSSAKPLRAYILNSAYEIRFTAEEYDPMNFSNPRTYITDGWEEYGVKMVEEVSIGKHQSYFMFPLFVLTCSP